MTEIDKAVLKARCDADEVREFSETFDLSFKDEEWSSLFRSSLAKSGFAIVEKDEK